MTVRPLLLIILTPLLACHAGAAAAQQAAPAVRVPGTLSLAALQQAAIDTDPRTRDMQLLASQTDLRLRNITTGRLPALSVEGLNQYESDVPHAAFLTPAGQTLFAPPKITYDAYVRVDQRLFDPTLSAQAQVERAELLEQQAGVRTTLFGLRQQVNDAFFAAAALQQKAGDLAAAIEDLETRLRETDTRVREGAALPADAAAVEAALLERRQDASQVRADRRAALARLSTLTGQPIGEGETLDLPDLEAAVARVRAAAGAARARPEYDQFARTRDRLARQQDLTSALDRPRLSAFGRVGYAKPGLNIIGSEFEAYALGGVRVQWNAWPWGAPDRERQALAIQQEIVGADEQAFTKAIVLANDGDLETIDRLHDVLALDDRIVMLREQVERSTEARLRESVVTASEYLDRLSDLLRARFARSGHQVELEQANARLLTTLGLEVR